MPVPARLLKIKNYCGDGYKPVVDFEAWRIAVLNYIDDLEHNKIKWIQKHNETDESFVLLSGKCILFIFEGIDIPGEMYAEEMQPFKVYNVRAGVWHCHTLTKDAKVLIVENSNTRLKNSPRVRAEKEYLDVIASETERLWK